MSALRAPCRCPCVPPPAQSVERRCPGLNTCARCCPHSTHALPLPSLPAPSGCRARCGVWPPRTVRGHRRYRYMWAASCILLVGSPGKSKATSALSAVFGNSVASVALLFLVDPTYNHKHSVSTEAQASSDAGTNKTHRLPRPGKMAGARQATQRRARARKVGHRRHLDEVISLGVFNALGLVAARDGAAAELLAVLLIAFVDHLGVADRSIVARHEPRLHLVADVGFVL